MSANEQDRGFVPVADPAPLGLAAFALTTFLLSGHNASFMPDAVWIGAAIFTAD
jgi:succinate-acetate transporter protein